MRPRPTNNLARARLALVLVLWCGAASVAPAFYLINPLSYWPASNVAGNVVFQVGLVASPPNVPNPPLTDGSATWDAAFVTQMDAWNAILPDNVLVLQAVTGSVVTPGESDGVNNVFFSGTVYGDTWGASTVGVCLSSWSGNRRVEADVLFNSTKTWNAYTGNVQGGVVDFRRVALHELGHALLLDHPDDVGQSVNAIMNSSASNTDALTTDDIAGVTRVFGALTPVTITAQPRESTSTNGTVRLTATAAGSEPITYQWQRSINGGGSWSNLAGVTFPNGSAGSFNNGDQFRIIVTNQLGSVTSRAFTFTIAAASAPNFDLNPVSATINDADDIVLTAHATGSPTPTYQWEYSSNGGGTWQNVFSSSGETDVTGSTSPSLRMTHVGSAINGFQFRAVATNGSGNATSAVATLTVNAGGPAPYFTWQPLDVYAQSGANAQIVAGTSGSPSPSRQWQRSTNGGGAWSNLANDGTFSGVTASTLTVTGVTTGMSGHLFRLNLTNGSGNATSRVVTLSVGSAAAAPTITDDPDNVVLTAAGQNAAFAAVVTALPAPVFQWEISADGVAYSPLSDGALPLGTSLLATIVSGANTRALTVANVAASIDTFRFRLVVRNASGTATTAAATVTISAGGTAPSITTQPSNATKVTFENATFTAAASGTPTPALQWQRSTNSGGTWANLSNDVTFSGVTTGTLTVTSVSLAMSGHQFRVVATNGVLPDATSGAATLTVNASTSRLINLSVRTGAGTGSQTLIVGFVVGGTGTNQVLVRGIGPTLGTFGVPGVLADPQQRIFSGSTLVQENDDWGGGATLTAAFSSVFAFALPPTSKDAAMLATLNTGSYTSHCSSTAGTGIALVELYDMLAPGSTARLINVSARTQVETGDGILIAGFVIDGATSKTLLIRGIGPTLGDFGVGGVLVDPQLALYSGSTVVQSNDNWGGTAPLTAAFNAVFAFALPGASKDAAMLVTLAPGTYTAQVSGVGATTGVALVEVYEMP